MVVSKTPKIEDFPIQTKTWEKAKNREFFGVFLDPGMGKSRVFLKEAEQFHRDGKIDAAVIFSKNSGKTNWVIWDHMIEDPEEDRDAVSDHLAGYPVIKGLWISQATGDDKKCWADFEKKINGDTRGKLIILVVNYQALLVPRLFEFLEGFMKQFRTILCADESTQIGAFSQRTKKALKLRKLAKFARVLSGSPVLKKPFKIFYQAKFADNSTGRALGFTNAIPFRHHYAEIEAKEIRGGPRKGDIYHVIKSYLHLDELAEKIDAWSIRAAAQDHLEMPERTWAKKRVYMTDEQAKAYKSMREECVVELEGQTITASIVLAQMTRLQQILGGYIKDKQGRTIEIIPPKRNPKLKETFDIIEDAEGQVVVWFRFRAELEGMAQMLRAYKDPDTGEKITFYEFHGGTPEGERVTIRKGFKRGERDVVLATTDTGGDSIDEFKVANTVIFVSNDANTEKRVQAERRNWRAGSSKLHKTINYYDIIVPNSVDMRFLKIMRDDSKISALLHRETWREWI